MRRILDRLEDSALKHIRLEALNHVGYIAATIIALAGLLNYGAFQLFAKTYAFSIPIAITTALVLIMYFINRTSHLFITYNIQLRDQSIVELELMDHLPFVDSRA